uniref:Putative secreted protein n=1 Tax=Anopheles darlingi TaxID=43151 RepID=A0A2M4DN95_ANODA
MSSVPSRSVAFFLLFCSSASDSSPEAPQKKPSPRASIEVRRRKRNGVAHTHTHRQHCTALALVFVREETDDRWPSSSKRQAITGTRYTRTSVH